MRNKGFTLFEILVYVAISTVVAGLAVGSLLSFTRIGQRESSSAEVTGEMNFVLQRIQQLVSGSSNIDIAAGVSTSTVKLRMQDPAKDPTCISLAGGVIKLAEGPDSPDIGGCNPTTSDLTSSKVVVNSLSFKKMTSYPGHDTLSVDMTLSYGTSTASQSYIQKTLSTAIARVSAATFDANVLPGSATYTLGQSTLPWQNVFVGDGSAANPSYSFGNSVNTGLYKASGTSTIGVVTGGTERMTIASNGNVGIGTTNPGTKLQVVDGSISILETGISQTTMSYGTGKFTLGLDSAGTDGIYFRTYSSGYADRMVIKSTGNVGIGTTNPIGKLDVQGGLFYVKTSDWSAGVSGSGAYINPGATTGNTYMGIQALTAGAAAVGNLVLNEIGGNVGIGTTNPLVPLHIKGSIAGSGNCGGASFQQICLESTSRYVQITTYGTSATGGYLQFDSSGGQWTVSSAAWAYNSDRRMKENISYLDGVSGLDKIMALKPASFDYISGTKNNLGFIAQDVQKVIPEAVSVTDEKTGMLGLKTDFIIPYLVNSTKELNAKIENLQTENNELKSLVCQNNSAASVCQKSGR